MGNPQNNSTVAVPGAALGAAVRVWFRPPSDAWWGWKGWIAAALFVGVWYYLATALVAQVNRDRLRSDQQSNIELARDSRADWFPRRTDGVVNPLWPWIAARFAPERDAEFFETGKWANVAIACAALLLVGRSVRRKVSPIALCTGVVLGGLGCLLPHAVYFQPEPIFYLLFTGVWVAGLVLMRRNPLWLYALFGLLCGLAYLAKASVTPFAVVFFGAGLVRMASSWFWPGESAEWSGRRHVAGLLLALSVSGVVTLPRALYAKERFGHPYHGYPKYWMWHDDFGTESVPFMARFGDAESLRAMTPEERPSFGAFISKHGWSGLRDRLVHGTWEKTWRFYLPERRLGNNQKAGKWKVLLSGRGLYLLGFMAIGAAMCVAGARPWHARKGQADHGQRGDVAALVSMLLLGIGAYCIYSLAYGWYNPIGRGDRFMMTLYLPLTVSLLWVLEYLRKGIGEDSRAWWVYVGGHTAIAVLLAWRLFVVVSHPLFLD